MIHYPASYVIANCFIIVTPVTYSSSESTHNWGSAHLCSQPSSCNKRPGTSTVLLLPWATYLLTWVISIFLLQEEWQGLSVALTSLLFMARDLMRSPRAQGSLHARLRASPGGMETAGECWCWEEAKTQKGPGERCKGGRGLWTGTETPLVWEASHGASPWGFPRSVKDVWTAFTVLFAEMNSKFFKP